MNGDLIRGDAHVLTVCQEPTIEELAYTDEELQSFYVDLLAQPSEAPALIDGEQTISDHENALTRLAQRLRVYPHSSNAGLENKISKSTRTTFNVMLSNPIEFIFIFLNVVLYLFSFLQKFRPST